MNASIRAEFPILSRSIRKKSLTYLDSAASTQKPREVLDCVRNFYLEEYANIHRGVHWLSEQSTRRFENVRDIVQKLLNTRFREEIIFTRGTTEGINLVASSFGSLLKSGDEILISGMEHHSNIVPWQLLRERQGVVLRVCPLLPSGDLDFETLQKLITEKTKLVSIVHISNSLGVLNPVREIAKLAHSVGAKFLVDAAQSVAHRLIDVQEIDCDFLVFSGHKIYGPTGTGVLFGKKEILERMPPWQGGGDMIESVAFEKTTFAPLPAKFEAGTPAIGEVIGLGAALEWLNKHPFDSIIEHEKKLLKYAHSKLSEIRGLRFIGSPLSQLDKRSGAISFVMDKIHAHDLGTILDREGVAIRTGHHCTQPVMDFFGVPATARASFGIYNIEADVDALVLAIQKAKDYFA